MAKKKEKWEDDGRTVAPMTGEEIPPSLRGVYGSRIRKRNLENGGKTDLTKKERRAMVRAMFLTLLPRFLVILASFGIVFLLMYLWLM